MQPQLQEDGERKRKDELGTTAVKALLKMGPPGGGEPRVPAEAGGVCRVARLSPPALRSGLHWLRGSCDDPLEERTDGGWLLCWSRARLLC